MFVVRFCRLLLAASCLVLFVCWLLCLVCCLLFVVRLWFAVSVLFVARLLFVVCGSLFGSFVLSRAFVVCVVFAVVVECVFVVIS